MDLNKICEIYESKAPLYLFNYIKDHIIRAAVRCPKQKHTTIYIKTMLTRLLLSSEKEYSWSAIFTELCNEFENDLKIVMDPSQQYIFIEWV